MPTKLCLNAFWLPGGPDLPPIPAIIKDADRRGLPVEAAGFDLLDVDRFDLQRFLSKHWQSGKIHL
jgi:hypothetical protein